MDNTPERAKNLSLSLPPRNPFALSGVSLLPFQKPGMPNGFKIISRYRR